MPQQDKLNAQKIHQYLMELDSQAADTGRHRYTAKEVQYMQERLNEIEQLYKQDVLGEYTASKDDPEHQTQSQIANEIKSTRDTLKQMRNNAL
ncbi:hypothetical protein O0I10_010906 [Lichtheimia ornata]|uniref:Uncharacterized protein n=1 Tax=Lichtheimia ornata TaxID=688661 RepID=A0AAD7UUG1_9FUNG|nr:uncharacterized protein O0I10_010906 [Lichtheimia ornata]KAJ8653470.1 hypothetical protein O0I10_010906 [Lichtheimia ornata]